jgi:hypothetical protein
LELIKIFVKIHKHNVVLQRSSTDAQTTAKAELFAQRGIA